MSAGKKGDFLDELHRSVMERARQLQCAGMHFEQAHSRAFLEYQLSREWPSCWGDDLQVLIYGDFRAPARTMQFADLGITVHPEKQEGTFAPAASCVLRALVTLSERTVEAFADAARRINVLLGAWVLLEWGRGPCGWCCHLTSGSGGVVSGPPKEKGMQSLVRHIVALRPEVRKKVDAALYWLREPLVPLTRSYPTNVLRRFSAYWNAFECLVDAVALVRPVPKMTRRDKRLAVERFCSVRGGKLTPADVEQCYREVVNPGFAGKATHALKVLFPKDADRLTAECFSLSPRRDRLYEIRNAVNHGEVDAENVDELMRVEARMGSLSLIVLRMFGSLLPFPVPADWPETDESESATDATASGGT